MKISYEFDENNYVRINDDTGEVEYSLVGDSDSPHDFLDIIRNQIKVFNAWATYVEEEIYTLEMI